MCDASLREKKSLTGDVLLCKSSLKVVSESIGYSCDETKAHQAANTYLLRSVDLQIPQDDYWRERQYRVRDDGKSRVNVSDRVYCPKRKAFSM